MIQLTKVLASLSRYKTSQELSLLRLVKRDHRRRKKRTYEASGGDAGVWPLSTLSGSKSGVVSTSLETPMGSPPRKSRECVGLWPPEDVVAVDADDAEGDTDVRAIGSVLYVATIVGDRVVVCVVWRSGSVVLNQTRKEVSRPPRRTG
jgi:hypothetical protein